MVLGVSSKLADGSKNLFFESRMNAAAKLFKAGKVDKLLVSGSRAEPYYDEATTMTAALMERGVPPSKIDQDNAGHRTLDSMIRAREVYNLDTFTIISQPFHNHRALYIAHERGIPAIAYNAEPITGFDNVIPQIREHGARVLMMLDLYLLDTQPQERD